MKYHRLSQEQLNAMHKEFSVFLAAQSIDKVSWDTIKSDHPERVDSLLDTFSDIVWDSIIEKCKYLKWNDQQQLFLFQCEPDTISVFIIKISNPSINIETPKGWEWLKTHFFSDAVEIFQSRRDYGGSRSLFIYDYLKKGAVITDGQQYDEIARYFSKSAK